MEIFIAAVILVGLCVIGMCFNIIFRKNGKFPDTEIRTNVEMRKRGIVCAKEEEMRLWGRKKGTMSCSDCGDCTSCGIGARKALDADKEETTGKEEVLAGEEEVTAKKEGVLAGKKDEKNSREGTNNIN